MTNSKYCTTNFVFLTIQKVKTIMYQASYFYVFNVAYFKGNQKVHGETSKRSFYYRNASYTFLILKWKRNFPALFYVEITPCS